MHTCRFAHRTDLAMSCFPILTPYPGTAFYEQYEREGRIRTRDWERYNGASVVFEPKRMTAKQLRHAQMAAFAEFYSLRSAFRRLRIYPVKSRAWLANLAIWKGIRYYYAKKGRQVPMFRDFLDAHSRAWNYPNEAWDSGLPAPPHAPRSASADTLITSAMACSDPLVQAGLALGHAGDVSRR